MNTKSGLVDLEKNISFVVASSLCTGCGTCAGVCPGNAIRMDINSNLGIYLPRVSERECTHCGVCVKCCPGHAVDMQKLNSILFGKQPKDVLLGNFLNSYVGHSNDAVVRSVSSSGGAVTQLLVFALEKGIIDGALVSRMKKSNPLEPEPFIAKTRDEIISAATSKYCPVPSNLSLRKIIETKGKFAVVGLPCHMHGVRLAESIFNDLKEKIVIHIGLFCSHTVNFHGTELLLHKYGINATEVNMIQYRGNGWPGAMSLQLKNGHSIRKRFIRGWNAYWNIFSCFFFTPTRCLMCPDQSNEFSDISVGDAWLPEFRNSSLGEAVILTRSRESEILLHQLRLSDSMALRSISPNKVRESQAFTLDFKKRKIADRFSLLKLFGMSLPAINPLSSAEHSFSYSAFLPYLSTRISSNKCLKRIMRYVPLPIFRLYFGLIKYSSLFSTRRVNGV